MTYNVIISTEVTLELEVEAESEEEARDKACDAINSETYTNGTISFEALDEDVSLEDVYPSDYYNVDYMG